MKKICLLLGLVLITAIVSGRNYTELQNWLEKELPSTIKSGITVEVYDLKKASTDGIDINIRSHNMSSKTVTELNVKVWLWKDEGVYVEELTLVTGNSSFDYLNSGRDDYFPGKNRYHRINAVKYDEVREIQLEISRIVSKRVR